LVGFILLGLAIPGDFNLIKQKQNLQQPAVYSPAPPAFVMENKLEQAIKSFLEAKKSPLASDTGYLLTKPHWKLIIAISAIESQYCKRQLNYNCWGITKKGGGYRKFLSWKEGIDATDELITKWQNKKKWLTIEAMNCSYVVPCSDNWVKVVKNNVAALDRLEIKSQEGKP